MEIDEAVIRPDQAQGCLEIISCRGRNKTINTPCRAQHRPWISRDMKPALDGLGASRDTACSRCEVRLL